VNEECEDYNPQNASYSVTIFSATRSS